MRIGSKGTVAAVAALSVAMVLPSCAAKRPSTDYGRVTLAKSEPAGEALAQEMGSRLLTKTASMRVAVPSVPQATEEVTRFTRQVGGYIHDSSIEKDTATFDLRVPAAKLDAVLDQLAGLGEEESRQVSAEDVTDEVADLEAQLANKRALRNRLRALLARAKDVKDVLSVETELTRLQTDIDSIEGRLKRMRSRSLCPQYTSPCPRGKRRSRAASSDHSASSTSEPSGSSPSCSSSVRAREAVVMRAAGSNLK